MTATGVGDKPALFSLDNNALYTVTNTGDSGSGSGLSGDLRYCITQADGQNVSTIQFSPSVTGTIALFSGLTTSSNVTIATAGASWLSVQGGGPTSDFSVFTVNRYAIATISGLTITNGYSYEGGAVYNDGRLVLTNVTISGNSSGDTGVVSNAPFATATLTNDTIAGNGGGGFFNFGTGTLTNATISGNTGHGGVYNWTGATVTLTNATISGNTGYGAVYNNGTATLSNTTISGNSGGVTNDGGTVTLDNTILANNDGGDLSGYGNLSGSNDLIGDGSGLATLTNSVSGNPLLAPLGNYGGSTQTMALLPGSPAIDAGSATITGVTVPTTDQRGQGRVGAVDIGAFESQGFTLTPVTGSTPQSATAGTAFANPVAVNLTANNAVEPVAGGIVSFSAPSTGASATLSRTGPVTIGSNGLASVTATANAMGGPYTVTASTLGAGSPVSFSLTNTVTMVFSGLTSPTIAYGTATVSLSGTILAGTVVPAGSVSITLAGVTQAAMIQSSGNFSTVFNTATLGEAGSPYTITYAYAASGEFSSASTTSTLNVQQATPTVSVADSGGTDNGSPFPATATVAGVVAGVDSTPAATLEGVAPSLTYYSGTYTTVAQLVGATPLGGAPVVAGSYTVLASFPGSADYTTATAVANFAITAPLPLTLTGLGPVSPNPRNSSVSSLNVTFNRPINLSSFTTGNLTLTDNGGANLIAGSVTITFVSASTYQVGGLTGLTGAEGNYTLNVSAAGIQDQNGIAGTGSLSTSWLMDTTPPVSDVNALPHRGTSLSFAVSVTGSDPTGAGNSPPSGVASYDIYASTNGGAWTLWTNVAASNPTATFTGQSNTTYCFYSIAHDNAGNTESKNPRIETSTYLPDLTPPVTSVDSTTGTNPTTVNNGTGTFTLNLTGTDAGGSGLAYFEVLVAIDAQPYQQIGAAIPAGVPDKTGADHSTATYQGLDDGVTHQYGFYSIGLDGAGNVQATPSAPNLSLAETFAQPAALQVTGLTVEHGAAERSYIRYLDIAFNESDSQSGSDLTQIAGSVGSASPEIKLYQYDLAGDASSKTAVSLHGTTVEVIDHAIELDFGAAGIGGANSTTPADGYYELDTVLPNGQTSVHHFYRLLGDVTGDGVVDNNDLNAIAAGLGQTTPAGLTPLNADVNGDGSVSAFDLTLATRSKGRKLGSGLSLG
ncbi:MAG: beta strand repeat-containing protein [Isosphaerales bacterium]